MANKNLFQSIQGKLLRKTDAVNEAGGTAYRKAPKHALAQFSMTGTFGNTYYTGAGTQLDQVLALAGQVEPDYVAKLAVYARQRGFMKDMPALLCAHLATRDLGLLQAVFPLAIDNGKMLRNFVQILRSGVVGRKSLGTRPKKLVQAWLAARSDRALLNDSVGNDPSIADVIKMVHPNPRDEGRRALYAYLIGKPYEVAVLPEAVRRYDAFKADPSGEPSDVEFRLLTALPLAREQWVGIARKAPWQMTRMNLNTFARHGVFEEREMIDLVAERLRDRQAIERARVFPYQLLAAYANTGEGVPLKVREALQDAMEIAIGNVPAIEGRVIVCPDVSGSMSGPVTGYRRGATSVVRCVDVAALVAAAVLRKNPDAQVLPFDFGVNRVRLNPRDSVMTNAAKLAELCGGGTDCSAPLRQLNRRRERVDLVWFVSDYESWAGPRYHRATGVMTEWEVLRQRNPNARLVCLDITPYDTSQTYDRADVLNLGGFSDHMFRLVAAFASGELDAGHWVAEIENIDLGSIGEKAA